MLTGTVKYFLLEVHHINMLRRTSLTILLLAAVSESFLIGTPTLETIATVPTQLSDQQFLVTTTSPISAISQRDLLAKSDPYSSSSLSLSTATTLPSTATPSSTSAPIVISDVNYDGKVPTTESDEYVVLTNTSKNPLDVSGYYLYVATSGSQGATFTFPKDSIIKPGSSVRVYTNEIHKETGGYSFGSGKAIWNNKGGLAVLRDAKGGKLGEFKYKSTTSS